MSSGLLHCDEGHVWEVPVGLPADNPASRGVCPTCGGLPAVDCEVPWRVDYSRAWMEPAVLVLAGILVFLAQVGIRLVFELHFAGPRSQAATLLVEGAAGAGVVAAVGATMVVPRLLASALFRARSRSFGAAAGDLGMTLSRDVPAEFRRAYTPSFEMTRFLNFRTQDCLSGTRLGERVAIISLAVGFTRHSAAVFPGPAAGLPDFDCHQVRGFFGGATPVIFRRVPLWRRLLPVRRPRLQVSDDLAALLHAGSWTVHCRRGAMTFQSARRWCPPEGWPVMLTVTAGLRGLLIEELTGQSEARGGP